MISSGPLVAGGRWSDVGLTMLIDAEMSGLLNPMVQRTRDSRFCLQFGRQQPRAADHRR